MSSGTGTQLRKVRRLTGVAPRGSRVIVGMLLVNLILSLLGLVLTVVNFGAYRDHMLAETGTASSGATTSAVALVLCVRSVFTLAWVASFLVAAEWVLRRRRGAEWLVSVIGAVVVLGYGWQAMTASLLWLRLVDVAHGVVGAGLLAAAAVPATRAGMSRPKAIGGER